MALELFVLVSRAALQKWQGSIFPTGILCQQTWVLDAVLHITKGMAKPGIAAMICEQVEKVLSTIKPGDEARHMQWILELVDFKGSEVRLKDATIVDGSLQAVPYPAFV